MKNNEIKIGMSSSFNYDITEQIVSRFDILKDEFDNNEEKFSYLKELMGFKDWFNHHYENGLVDLYDYIEDYIRLHLPDIVDDLFSR